VTICVVTATTNIARAAQCINSWRADQLVVVLNGATGDVDTEDIAAHWLVSPEYLGSVPAFRLGVNYALEQTDADIIACLHDDLEIKDPHWLARTGRHFDRTKDCGLAGFGGAIGLGDADLYKVPYSPHQLARSGFRSNMHDAEVHGVRSLLAEPVACLDGFSQIGRRAFFEGATYPHTAIDEGGRRPWTLLENLGVVHHAYDGMLGCLAARYGWSTWYLPIACQHYGGRTAVGDRGYSNWAAGKVEGGDAAFWDQAHRIWYDNFRDVLPLRV
jgi:hypothetical protein